MSWAQLQQLPKEWNKTGVLVSQASEQLFECKRFSEVVICAAVEALNAIANVISCGF